MAAAKRAPAPAASKAATDAEADWAAAEPAGPEAPLDFNLVQRSWGLVMERVRAGSRVGHSYLQPARPVGLEGRQVVLEYSLKDRFYAEALGKGAVAKVEAALQAVLGGGLTVRVVIGETAPASVAGEPATPARGAAPAPPGIRPAAPAEEPPPVEFEIDPEHDAGEPLDSDADARAVADWAAQQLGGQVIDERPNPRSRGSKRSGPKGSAARGSRG